MQQELEDIKKAQMHQQHQHDKKQIRLERQQLYAQSLRHEQERQEEMEQAKGKILREIDPVTHAVDSKGSEMLMKMGWSAGEGLGVCPACRCRCRSWCRGVGVGGGVRPGTLYLMHLHGMHMYSQGNRALVPRRLCR